MIDEIFSRTGMLLGQEGVEKLQASSVAIFGVGGVGSFAAEALARSGLGHIALIDHDQVCLSNINRQLIALHSTVGRLKAEVMKERILDINPHARVEVYPMFYGAETADKIDLSTFSYVVDAIDTVTAKLLLAEKCQAAGVRIISSMGAGNKLDATAFVVTDIFSTSVCPLAKVMRRELRARGVKQLKVVYSEAPVVMPKTEDEGGALRPGKKTPGSIAYVPSVAGLLLAGEVIKDLTGEL